MDNFTITVNNGINLSFAGERLAYTHDRDMYNMYDLYKTDSGLFVCRIAILIGDTIKYEHAIVDTTEGVIDFFGHNLLAIDLYKGAGIQMYNNTYFDTINGHYFALRNDEWVDLGSKPDWSALLKKKYKIK